MHSIYIIVTESCQMHCPFCYTKFADGFKNDKSIIDSKIAAKVINKGFITPNGNIEPFDYVIFHGGEPLLYPNTINDIMDRVGDKIKYGIQTNLAYKSLTKEQVELLIRLGSYGTSYSYDRFYDNEDIERQVINNVKYLETLGVYGTLLVTLTEDQCIYQSPKSLYEYIQEFYPGIKHVIFERPIFPIKNIDENRFKYTKIYDKADKWLVQSLDVFPKEMTDVYSRFEESIIKRRPFYPIHCTKYDCVLYKDKIKYGCPSIELVDGKNIDDSEKIEKECMYCRYYPYCGGDCQCMNHICAFPKRTFNAIRSMIINAKGQNRMGKQTL